MTAVIAVETEPKDSAEDQLVAVTSGVQVGPFIGQPHAGCDDDRIAGEQQILVRDAPVGFRQDDGWQGCATKAGGCK